MFLQLFSILMSQFLFAGEFLPNDRMKGNFLDSFF